MSRGIGLGCPVREGSGADTRPAAPDTRLFTREGSGAATHLVALDPASLLGRAPELPRVPWPQIPSPHSGGLWCHRVSHGYLTGPRIKKYQDITGVQRGSHVTEVHPRDIRCMQDMQADGDIMTCNASRPGP
jgi:hypothetical protein